MEMIIIGGGVAGLAAAIRLAHASHDVVLYEKNSFLGGKLSEIRQGDFRFDAGPSLFTMPHLVDELLTIDGKSDIEFSYQRLKTLCHYFWGDELFFEASADRSSFIQDAAITFGESEEQLQAFMQANQRKYELTKSLFLESPIKQLSTWFSSDAAKAYASLPSLDIFSKMHEVHERYMHNPKLIQLFDRYATYNGSSPYESSGIMTMISHLEYDLGAYFPQGGMYGIIKALKAKAVALGVDIRLDTEVTHILKKVNKIKGVTTSDGDHYADAVICNLDNYFTYKNLLSDTTSANKIAKQERSTSAIIFYWGVEGGFPNLDLHNIFFSEDYKAEFESLKRVEPYPDPTIYLNISAKYNTSDAPRGCENWFVMINVAAKDYEDEASLVNSYREIVISKLSRVLDVNISERIVNENYLSPKRLQQRTGAYLGALYGLSSNDRMAAFFRENNKSKKYKGLFFCGGTGHPGGGIPLCLLSAKISTKMINEYFNR